MTTTEERLLCKLPGEDTGIVTRSGICDICAPGPHCGVTCYVKDGRIIRVEGCGDHPVNRGRLCTRGLASRQYVYRKDRVLTPLHRIGDRGEGRFAPVSWDEALDETAYRLNEIKQRFGASAAAFYSGYNKWYRPFLQRLCYSFGSVNYGTESSACFTSVIMSCRLAAGDSFAVPDLSRAGLYLGWCCNPAHSSYLLTEQIDAARRRGMKVIIIDPRITPAAERQSDLFLRIRPGTDCALALGLARELITQGWIDRDYFERNVYGIEPFRNYAEGFPPERVEALTGIPADKVRLAARMIQENAPLAIHQSGAALVHGLNGMQTHRAVMALSALTGSYGRPGGMLPVPLTYAHSMAGFATEDHSFALERYPQNGPRPVGAERYPLWAKVVGEMQGTDLARQILEGTPYPVRALCAHGLNYRIFNGDTELRKALLSLDFFVDTDLFLTDTAKLADIVLPCCSSFERSEFKVFGGGYAQLTEPVIEPLGMSRPDDEIICELARRLELDDPLLRAGTEACLRYILRNTPVDLDELKQDRQHPHKLSGLPRIPPGTHGFRTPTGKYELWSTVIERFPGLDPLPTWKEPGGGTDPDIYPFTLVTGSRLPNALHSRLHDVPWLRSLRPVPTADMNDADAAALRLADGDPIHIRTQAGEITVTAHPTATVPPGAVFMYHGYREADVNAIIPPGHNDPYSGFPGYRNLRCAVEPAFVGG